MEKIPLNPDRLLAKVRIDPDSECWVWTGALMPNGYGAFTVKIDGKWKRCYPHRISYEIHIGEIPKGLDIDHLCRNRACINPAHLEPVSRRENLARGETLIAKQLKQTHCKNGHLLDKSNLSAYKLKKGKRECLTCHRERERKRRQDLRGKAATK